MAAVKNKLTGEYKPLANTPEYSGNPAWVVNPVFADGVDPRASIWDEDAQAFRMQTAEEIAAAKAAKEAKRQAAKPVSTKLMENEYLAICQSLGFEKATTRDDGLDEALYGLGEHAATYKSFTGLLNATATMGRLQYLATQISVSDIPDTKHVFEAYLITPIAYITEPTVFAATFGFHEEMKTGAAPVVACEVDEVTLGAPVWVDAKTLQVDVTVDEIPEEAKLVTLSLSGAENLAGDVLAEKDFAVLSIGPEVDPEIP